MELKDTVDLMLSEDYKERFSAELYQLNIRFLKLTEMLTKYKMGELDFPSSCPIWLLEQQVRAMGEYLTTLTVRANIEGIEL